MRLGGRAPRLAHCTACSIGTTAWCAAWCSTHAPLGLLGCAQATGACALAIASRLGHARLVRWLCSRSDLRPNEPDRYGVCALHKAVSFGQTACVEALLLDGRVAVDQRCAAPTVPDSFAARSGGETALHLAAAHTYTFHHQQHHRIARMLLRAGADPRLANSAGKTAVSRPVPPLARPLARPLVRPLARPLTCPSI